MNDDVETRLWRLAPNSEFEDVNGQVFRKTGATAIGTSFGERKIKKYEVVCLASPFTDQKPAGRVCSAFFTLAAGLASGFRFAVKSPVIHEYVMCRINVVVWN